jgi:hypothetical protein
MAESEDGTNSKVKGRHADGIRSKWIKNCDYFTTNYRRMVVVKGGKVVSGSPKHETGEEERLSGPASF